MSAPIAQRIEHLPSKQRVAGSIPAGRVLSRSGRSSAGLERTVRDRKVAGSNPVAPIFLIIKFVDPVIDIIVLWSGRSAVG